MKSIDISSTVNHKQYFTHLENFQASKFILCLLDRASL